MKSIAGNDSANENRVTVSVGIPAYNEEKMIGRLLEAVLLQPMNGIVLEEIIVNASGSTDSTEAKVADVARVDSRIKLISKKERRGKASALNAILRRAKGDIISFVDGDVILGRDSISTLIRPLLYDEEVGISSGNVMPIKEKDGFFAFLSRFVRELHHESCCHLVSRGLVPKVDGAFYAIRKNVLKHFPPCVVSDDEYASWRAQRKGYKIVYTPKAVVYTKDPSSFKDFIKWQKRIIAGQLYMKRHFSYTVPTMKAPITLPCFVRLLKKYPRRTLQILTLVSLACLSYLLALITFLRNEVPYAY